MEKRLIDANKLMQDVEKLLYEGNPIVAFIQKQVDKQPTVDTAPRWIPCEERLPEEYGLYLATMNDGFVQECSYVPENNRDALIGGWNTCESTGLEFIDEWDVIAWMPLPEPYREREGEQPERSSE